MLETPMIDHSGHFDSTVDMGAFNSALLGSFDSQSPKLPNRAHGSLECPPNGTVVNRQQAGFERRVSWLEEDIKVLQRRSRDEQSNASSNVSLHTVLARFEGELAAERVARQVLESRVAQLSDALLNERRERELQLNSISHELQMTISGLITRIDSGLSAGGAQSEQQSTILAREAAAEAAEERLRGLIRRVDEGLSAGAAALQDTLLTAAVKPSHSPGPGLSNRRPRTPMSLGKIRTQSPSFHIAPSMQPVRQSTTPQVPDQLSRSMERQELEIQQHSRIGSVFQPNANPISSSPTPRIVSISQGVSSYVAQVPTRTMPS